jgi:hypothetical protein
MHQLSVSLYILSLPLFFPLPAVLPRSLNHHGDMCQGITTPLLRTLAILTALSLSLTHTNSSHTYSTPAHTFSGKGTDTLEAHMKWLHIHINTAVTLFIVSHSIWKWQYTDGFFLIQGERDLAMQSLSIRLRFDLNLPSRNRILFGQNRPGQ